MNEETMAPSELNLSRLKRDRLFSCVSARILFFLFLLADLVWALYSLLLFVILFVAACTTCFKVNAFKEVGATYLLSLKRACVCAVALFLALFSPGFGIMIACTYFLMYDKEGLEEVVPASLQAQFKEFFHTSENEK
jgi:hypothetical protein